MVQGDTGLGGYRRSKRHDQDHTGLHHTGLHHTGLHHTGLHHTGLHHTRLHHIGVRPIGLNKRNKPTCWQPAPSLTLAPQSKMLDARHPSINVRRREAGGMASSSLRRSGSTESAAAFSRALSSLHNKISGGLVRSRGLFLGFKQKWLYRKLTIRCSLASARSKVTQVHIWSHTAIKSQGWHSYL